MVGILALVVLDVLLERFGFGDNNIVNLSIKVLPIVLLILHGALVLGRRRLVYFVLFAFGVGVLFEIIGIKSGVFFGEYYYDKLAGARMYDVPLIVGAYWSVFIYTGYTIVTSFLVWTNKKKPSISERSSLVLIPFLVVLDGLVVTAIDLFMDPLRVLNGSWVWVNGGDYFGVPVSNFVGWFVVVIIVTGVFRLYEYFRPLHRDTGNSGVYIIPLIGYLGIIISFTSSAFAHNLPDLALIGIAAMLPITVTNVILYINWQIEGGLSNNH